MSLRSLLRSVFFVVSIALTAPQVESQSQPRPKAGTGAGSPGAVPEGKGVGPSGRASRGAPSEEDMKRLTGILVMEFFTSECCPACVSVGPFLSVFDPVGSDNRSNFFLLEFHVDYLDGENWKDRYGTSAYAARQSEYAKRLAKGRTATPQIFLNGREAVTGFNPAGILAALDRRRMDPPKIEIEADLTVDRRSMEVEYSIDSVPAEARVNVALVERGIASSIGGGPNSGATIRHTHLVRGFRSVRRAWTGGNSVTLGIPEDMVRENAWVTVYVQDEKTLEVLGAAKASLGEFGNR